VAGAAADRELRERIRIGTTVKQREQLDKVLTVPHKNPLAHLDESCRPSSAL
jgi:hypothetical protein